MTDNIYILKYLNDELTTEEKAQFLNSLDKDDALKKEFVSAYNFWVKTGYGSRVSGFNMKKEFSQLMSRIEKPKSKIVLMSFSRYAAAIAVVLFIASLALVTYNYIGKGIIREGENLVYAYSSGDKSNATVTLPDGSTVKLNANTQLKYSVFAPDNKRHVTLEGEALFEVIHNETSPFVIAFNDLKIVDVGTVFNVKARPDDKVIETVLIEGLVDCIVDDATTVNLEPGDKATYNKATKDLRVTQINDDQLYLGWTRNRFVFKDKTFESVITEIANWYKVEVIWKNEKIKKELMFCNIKRNVELSTALDILNISFEFKYKLKKSNGAIKSIIIY
ncbi:MAG: FecR domain-containing protein [Carboxylicivirga sp.]|jgi:ferric-dicitrate binding protein FerR (iron transport regulator)|nr:FecR domain-containing protein [Carboxylicivirga sp.]